MALGKPVVSYVRESDLGFLPAEMREEMPVQNVTPQTLVDRLEEISINVRNGGYGLSEHDNMHYVGTIRE